MTRIAAIFALLTMPAACFLPAACHAGTLTRWSAQPQFSETPRPLAPVTVPWRASRPLTRGLELWASGRRDVATKWFEAAVHGLPGDPIAWHDLGVAYFCASRFTESHMCFQHERFLYAISPSALYGMAMCQMKMGRPDLAENDLAMALAEAPREWEYWHRFAEALAAQGKNEAAAVAGRNAAALKPRIRRPVWGLKGVATAIATLRFPRFPKS